MILYLFFSYVRPPSIPHTPKEQFLCFFHIRKWSNFFQILSVHRQKDSNCILLLRFLISLSQGNHKQVFGLRKVNPLEDLNTHFHQLDTSHETRNNSHKNICIFLHFNHRREMSYCLSFLHKDLCSFHFLAN